MRFDEAAQVTTVLPGPGRKTGTARNFVTQGPVPSKTEVPVDSQAPRKLLCHGSRFPELQGRTPAGRFQAGGKEKVACSG
jgi:hypothetical protein